MFIKKNKDRLLETIHNAEVLAGQLKAANEEIGESQVVEVDQDEVIAIIYEELLLAQDTIAAQEKTIKSLKTTANAAKKAAEEAVKKVEELSVMISGSEETETPAETPEVNEAETQTEAPAQTDEEVFGNE